MGVPRKSRPAAHAPIIRADSDTDASRARQKASISANLASLPGSCTRLTKLAGSVGLNEEEFEEALRTRKYRQAHQQALRHAYEEAGVTGVPMFVIGSQVLTGMQDRETLAAVIEKEQASVGANNLLSEAGLR